MNKRKATRVIIAEDEFTEMEDISNIIRRMGYDVIGSVPTGEKAIEMVCKLRPDVILMDIEMTGKMNGLEASKEIQSKCPTPVVILSGHETDDYIERACETGVGSYLTKPPKAEDIERAIIISMARHADLMAYHRLSERLAERTLALENALMEIKHLSGMLPICSSCKKIRDDKGYWNQIECYIQERSDALFSHGLCPECAEKLYGREEWYREGENK